MDKDLLVVDGFVFPSYKEAQIAQKELSNIEVIRGRIQELDGKSLYELYCKLLEKEMFNTMVGYSFLYEIRHKLLEEFNFDEQKLPNITLPKRMEYDKVYQLNKGKMENKIQQLMVTKTRMTITITVLIFMIIAMFVITAVNPNVGYLNVEHKIINKYSAWEQELERREAVIKEKEGQLNIDSKE